MVSVEEFYRLPEKEQQDLVDQRQVIIDQEPVNQIPDPETPVRILPNSLTTEVLEKIQKGRYTISELANEIGVRDKYIRRVINRYRHQRFEELLNRYNAVLRAKDNRGPALVYSLESVPYFARVMDPTLGGSLLQWRDLLLNKLESTSWIQAGKSAEPDEKFAKQTVDYWRLDFDETLNYIREFERIYVDTELGPLPIAKDEKHYEEVRERLIESESAYARRRNIDESTCRKRVNSFKTQRNHMDVGTRFYQCLSLTLFDLLEYTRHEEPTLKGNIEKQINIVTEWLEPGSSENNENRCTRNVGKADKEAHSGNSVGTPNETVDWEQRDLLIELVALSQDLGKLPSETEINDRTRFTHREYLEKFGSLANAFQQAGLVDEPDH